jgi:hypothetical protein
MLRKTLEIFLLILMTFSSLAHGDLHERIQVITADIHKFPEDIDLYYQRGSFIWNMRIITPLSGIFATAKKKVKLQLVTTTL